MARCALRWESLSSRQPVGRRLGDPPALRMWMLVVPLPVSLLYLYACKVLSLIYLSSLLLFRCCDRRPLDVALGGTSSLSCRAVSHTSPAGRCRRP